MIYGFKTVDDFANEWNLKHRTIQIMCANGRIEGATKVGNVWLIPENTDKPKDLRVKSGKYIKDKTNGGENEQKNKG